MSTTADDLEALFAIQADVMTEVKKRARQAAIERRLATNQPRYDQRPSLRWGPLQMKALDEAPPWVAEQVRMVETVTSWLDSVGAQVGPNPQGANSVEEFVDQLRLLYAWAGEPTLRELEKRAGIGKLPRSSVSDMLRGTGRLPKIDLATEFVKACGAEAALPAWLAAWHRLKRPRSAGRQSAA